jgi:D-serine deaminase-like pyridoxal phosphate-dependent protein
MNLDPNQLTSPTLLVDEATCRANLTRMMERARRHDLQLAPHFKTHQSARVGEWVREAGVEAITVTSLRMATYFADHGWTDITIAMPLNPRELPALLELAARVHLTVFINGAATAARVAAAVGNSGQRLTFYTEIDTGYGRSGVRCDDPATIDAILARTATVSELRFLGFYTHSGHTYAADTPEEILAIHRTTLDRLGAVKRAFATAHPDLRLSLGDTPACSLAEEFTGISVIRPGNFVYYDLTQARLGACTREQIAICVACPVLEVHPGRGEAIIHGGWVQLGKDRLVDERGVNYYGEVVRLDADGWTIPGGPAISGGGGPDISRVRGLSQEHGTVRLPPDLLEELRPGDLIGVLPVHACATVDAMGGVVTLAGGILR